MQRTKVADIRLHDAARQEGGPGRAFCLSGETLFELVSQLESRATDKELQIAGIAGDRAIRLRCRSPLEWIEKFYEHAEEGAYVN